MNAPPEKIYRCCYGIHMNGSEDIAWITTPNHYIEAAYPHTHIEYLRSDIHEREMKEAFYAGVDYADSIPAEMDLHGRDVHFDEWVKRRENDTQTIQSHWLRGYGNISW